VESISVHTQQHSLNGNAKIHQYYLRFQVKFGVHKAHENYAYIVMLSEKNQKQTTWTMQ